MSSSGRSLRPLRAQAGSALLVQRRPVKRPSACLASSRSPHCQPLSSPQRQPLSTQSSRRQQPDAFHTQLDDLAGSPLLHSFQKAPLIPQTLTEKIVQRYAVGLAAGKRVRSGDYVTLAPHHCMSHDNSMPILSKFRAIGASRVADPRQIVMTLDHDVQNTSEANLAKYRRIEEFARAQGVDFYPAGRGIGHQIMVEEGYAFPGTLAVASDSHSNMYGALGCLGTPVVRTDAASIWATKRTWWQIPPVAKVNFTGTLPTGVTGKDVIVALCGLFNNDEVLNHCIEFTGSPETLRSVPIDHRLAIANMTTEWTALSAIFPVDSVLERWLRFKATEAAMFKGAELADGDTAARFNHARLDELFADRQALKADPGASYAKEFFLNLSTLSPYVSGPNSVKVATPLAELQRISPKINKAYLVSCTNSRASDLASAAKVFKDAAESSPTKEIPRIPDHVKLYIAAASMPEQQAAEEQGDWATLIAAGAKPLPSGCGPCIGLGTGLLEAGQVGISASNRNFKGRMGSTDAKAYLASPEVVAASALAGKIAGPGNYVAPDGWNGVEYGVGDGIKEEERMLTVDESLERLIADADAAVADGEKALGATTSNTATPPTSASPVADSTDEALTDILPGFPAVVQGEIIFCDADNVNTDAIYPGKFTYQDGMTTDAMAAVAMQNYDANFASIARPGDILVAGSNFGCGSSREQAATALLAKQIPLVVAGSFGNIFSRNSINNALLSLEVPRLVQRLREAFAGAEDGSSGAVGGQASVTEPELNRQSLDSPPPGPMYTPKAEKVLTRRTGWQLTWDVRRSKVTVREGESGKEWSEKVGEMPPNVQEIIACGGLEKWVKAQIEAGT